MLHHLRRPLPLALALAFLTAIPILTGLIDVLLIPSGAYPPESAHLGAAPVSWFAHALAGVVFGLTGPVQFVRAVRNRFGLLHRVLGVAFVLSGAILGLSALSLLAQVTPQRTAVVDVARGLFGLALLFALTKAMVAIRSREILRHRAWVIRAYAVGMGLAAVSLVFFPIFLVTGRAPTGLASDVLFVASWLLSIAIGELVIRSLSRSSPQVPA